MKIKKKLIKLKDKEIKKEKEKVLLFIGWSAIGDYFAVNGMINFISNYYDKIYIINESEGINNNLKSLFSHNSKIIIITKRKKYLISFDCDILDYRKKYFKYFAEYLNTIDEIKFKYNGEKLNAIHFYENIGLNHEIMFSHFNYKRDIIMENLEYNNVLKGENYKYNIINSKDITHNQNNYVNINVSFLVKNQLNLFKLFENASSFHMIDNSNMLFLVFLIKSNKIILKSDCKIYFYPNLRYRGKITRELLYFLKTIDNVILIE